MTDILNSVKGVGGGLLDKGQSFLDSLFPPEKRAELMTKLQTFAMNHPKLSAFLLCQFALTGFPLFMFVAFTITVFVFSLVAALLIGVLVALVFTVFMVGVALLVILPTTFLAAMAATFIFLWGLGGYYILKWFNKGDSPSAPGTAIGDKLNDLTGGRISFLMDTARSNEQHSVADSKKSDDDNSVKSPPPKKSANGGPPKLNPGDVTDKVGKTVNVDGVKKQANLDGVTKRVGNVTNTAGAAKGVIGGATGLT